MVERRGKMGYPPASLGDEMHGSHMSACGIVDDDGCGPGSMAGMIQKNHRYILVNKWVEMVQLLRIRRQECDDAVHPPVKKALCIGDFFPRTLCRVHDNDAIPGFVG